MMVNVSSSPRGSVKAPAVFALGEARRPDTPGLECEAAGIEVQGPVSVVRDRIDDRLQRPFVILLQSVHREDLETGTQGPTFARGVAEADDLRSLAVFPCAFEELLLCSTAADGARDARFRHDRHRPGDARHRPRVLHHLDQHRAVTRAERLERMRPRFRANLGTVFHPRIVAERPMLQGIHRFRNPGLPADHADDADPSHPANHRDTENTEPPTRVFEPHRNSTRRHEVAESQRHKENRGNSIVRRGPGRRAARDRWVEPLPRTQALVAASRATGPRSRRAQASPLTLIRDSRSRRYEYGGTDAPCASAGGKPDRDGCSHPERSGFSPEGRRLRIAGISAGSLQATYLTQVSGLCAFASLRLCVKKLDARTDDEAPVHSGQPRRSRFRSFVFFVSSWLRRYFALCLLCASVVFRCDGANGRRGGT